MAMDADADMDVEGQGGGAKSPSFVDELFSSEEDKCLRAVLQLKYSLIGSNRQKHAIVERGLVPRLISLLADEESSPQLRVNVAYTLGSVAKGAEYQLKALIDSGIVSVLLNRELVNTVELLNLDRRTTLDC